MSAVRFSDDHVDPAVARKQFAGAFTAWTVAHATKLESFRPEPYIRLAAHVDRLRPLHELLYDAGWSRWGWPVDAGGLGGHPSLRGVLYDELAQAGLELPRGFELLEVIGPALVQHAPDLAARYLPALLSGRELLCQGFSEPEAGSDLASLRTRAVAAGDNFRISGRKTWIGNGHIAHRCLLLARTGPDDRRHRGLTMFWVDMRLPGISTRPIELADGRDELAEIYFDDVAVPADHVVGALDGGWAVAMYLLAFERGNWAWQRQAWLGTRLGDAVAQARAGAPDTASVVGEAWLAQLALRASSRDTLLQLADDAPLGARTSIDKILMSTAERAIFDAARVVTWPATELDSAGAISWAPDWFYSRSTSVYGGAVEVQRDIVAEQVLGLPRK